VEASAAAKKLRRVAIVILKDPSVTKYIIPTQKDAHSKTFEYNSFLALNNWIPTKRLPSGNEINESMKLPWKLTLHIDAEHIPPININWAGLYIGFFRMRVSSSEDASETESSS
jgi:hypothetical protein